MTDLEAVAGVIDSVEWCCPAGRYFDVARELLTLETNAAIEGFLTAGARRIVVCDGHGWGGITPSLLHPRAELVAGLSNLRYPLGLDSNFEVMAWVGQHAMAGAPFAHLPHTQGFEVQACFLNEHPIGEIGQMAFVAAELGVRSIFLSGDRAGCDEAQALIPGIRTVAVKEGLSSETGHELSAESAERAFTAARHLAPGFARERIRETAAEALVQAQQNPSFGRLMVLPPPYTLKTVFRAHSEGEPAKVIGQSHPTSVSGAFNAEWESLVTA